MISAVLKRLLRLASFEYKYGKIIPIRAAGAQYHKPVLDASAGNSFIANKINAEAPFLAGRIGTTELYLLLHYLHYKRKKKIPWSDYHGQIIWQQSGIFPATENSLRSFCDVYMDAIKQTDVMGVWNDFGEDEVLRRYAKRVDLIPLQSLEPYFFDGPWSKMLAGKKVLVVHPFTDSIYHQYVNNREFLFKDPAVLPPFEIKVVKAVQAQVFNPTGFQSWQEIFNHLKASILQQEFDIAIIGAGGYGLPLAAWIKALGKQAIHMGGATQILFGVKGKRWEEREEFSSFFNNYWCNPSVSELPKQAVLLEGGAYW